ncbi:MAG: hypothetical protein Q9220_007644 [cf. Caloplaca sp. 1 TL-2023]
MSGRVVLFDHQENRVLDERRDHTKYVVQVTHARYRDCLWVATAGWDRQIWVYCLRGTKLGEPMASVRLATNPETVTFISHPESDQPTLLVTRRDSTFLHYYQCRVGDLSGSLVRPLQWLGRQNLAPHTNAWVSWSPSSVAISPNNGQLLAVATSTIPHAKAIIVRLLMPPLQNLASQTAPDDEHVSHTAQTHQRFASEDQEAAAIQLHVNTFAPQTPYSTPKVCWRPDGSGIWINGDDGVVRGLDASNGKICSTLRDGHEAGSKIRSMWAGMVDVEGKETEWLVSGGFDKRLVVWSPGDDRNDTAA